MRLIIFSILLLTVFAKNNLLDRTYAVDQLLNEYELEVQSLPEHDDEDLLKPSHNRSLNDILDQYEKEASILKTGKRQHANLKQKPRKDNIKGTILNSLLAGVSPASGGRAPALSGVSDILNSIMQGVGGTTNAITELLCKVLSELLTKLAEIIRGLAASLTETLIKSISGALKYLEPVYGADNFLVRFLQEFFDEQTSPFLTSIEASKRLDKIMELYWTGGKQAQAS